MSDPFTRAFTGGVWGGRRARAPTAGDYSTGQHLSVAPPRPGTTPAAGDMTLYRPPQMPAQSTKEAEAAGSFRIFEAIQALRDGKLPTNDQLVRIIDQVSESQTLSRKKADMSEDGSRFVDDLIDFLAAFKRVVEDKNDDEDIQEFIFHTRLAATSPLAAEKAKVTADVAKDTEMDPTEAFNKSMLVARLMITNASFRDLVSEFADIAQDMMEGIRQKRGTATTSRYDSGIEQEETVGVGTTGVGGSSSAYPPTSTTERPYRYFNPDEDVSSTPVKPVVADSAYSSPGTARTRIETTRSEGKRQLSADEIHEVVEERLTPERRVRLVERLRDAMKEVHENLHYVEAVDFLLDSVGSLTTKTTRVSEHAGRTTTGRKRRTDANIRAARHDLKHLIARFAGDQDIQPLLDAIKVVNARKNEDFYLRDFMADVRLFLDRSLHESDYVDHPDYIRKGSDLINRGRALFFEGYRDEVQSVLDEAERIIDGFRNDEVTQEFGRTLRNLVNNFFFDQEGKLTFKDELARDFATVLLPIVVSQVRYIPIPRIEHNDENIHIIVENIILTSDNFLPNVMEIKMKNAAVVGLRSELASQTATSVTLNFYQIYADIRDVPFFFRKKTGFPKLQDHGVANIFLGGQGMSIILKLGLDMSSGERTLWIRKCKTYVDDLRIEIRESRHDPLYRAAAPIIDGAVRRAIQTTVETQVRDWVGYLDSQITGLKTSTAQAAAAGKPMQEATLNRFLASLGVQSAKKRLKGTSGAGAGSSTRKTESKDRMLEAPRTSTYRTGGETTYRTEYRASEPGYRSGETSYRTSYVSGDSEPTYESYMRESGTTTGMKEGSSQARV